MAGATSPQVLLKISNPFVAHSNKSQFTLYTSDASQWAFVAHLTIDAKGYKPGEYAVKHVGLGK